VFFNQEQMNFRRDLDEEKRARRHLETFLRQSLRSEASSSVVANDNTEMVTNPW
jgi:hypothetical protein